MIISTFIYSGKRDNGKRDFGKWNISKCFRGNGTYVLSGKWDILCSGRRDTLFSGKQEILSSGNDFFPLGIGPLILWESGHPAGNGTWETGDAILLDSGHLSSGKHSLGKRYLRVRYNHVHYLIYF